MRRIRAIGFSLLGVAAMAGALLMGFNSDSAPGYKERDGGRGRGRLTLGGWDAALRLLNPPGAGYDSTNISLSTASGGAVTFTSATPRQYCPDSSGALRSLGANKPCVVDGLSLKVRSAVTNSVLQSEDLSTTWTSVGTPIVTNNTWDFGVGSATGDTLTDDDGAADEGRQQSVTTAATGAWTFSVYMQSGTASTARLVVNVTGGTGSTTCAVSGLTTTTSRQTCSITAGTGVTALTIQILVGSSAAGAGTVKVGGMQLVQASVPGDYCPTTGTNPPCSAETATVVTPASLSLTEGCAKVCITPSWTGIPPTQGFFVSGNAAATARLFYDDNASTLIHSTGGGGTTGVDANWTSGVRTCFLSQWTVAGTATIAAGTKVITNLTVGTSNSAGSFTGFPSFDATLAVGNNHAGTLGSNARVDTLVLGRSPNACGS